MIQGYPCMSKINKMGTLCKKWNFPKHKKCNKITLWETLILIAVYRIYYTQSIAHVRTIHWVFCPIPASWTYSSVDSGWWGQLFPIVLHATDISYEALCTYCSTSRVGLYCCTLCFIVGRWIKPDVGRLDCSYRCWCRSPRCHYWLDCSPNQKYNPQ